jgi:hypothetical protein
MSRLYPPMLTASQIDPIAQHAAAYLVQIHRDGGCDLVCPQCAKDDPDPRARFAPMFLDDIAPDEHDCPECGAPLTQP